MRSERSRDMLRTGVIISGLLLAAAGDRYIAYRRYQKAIREVRRESRCGYILTEYSSGQSLLSYGGSGFLFLSNGDIPVLHTFGDLDKMEILVVDGRYCNSLETPEYCGMKVMHLPIDMGVTLMDQARKAYEEGISDEISEAVNDFDKAVNFFNNCTSLLK